MLRPLEVVFSHGLWKDTLAGFIRPKSPSTAWMSCGNLHGIMGQGLQCFVVCLVVPTAFNRLLRPSSEVTSVVRSSVPSNISRASY